MKISTECIQRLKKGHGRMTAFCELRKKRMQEIKQKEKKKIKTLFKE